MDTVESLRKELLASEDKIKGLKEEVSVYRADKKQKESVKLVDNVGTCVCVKEIAENRKAFDKEQEAAKKMYTEQLAVQVALKTKIELQRKELVGKADQISKDCKWTLCQQNQLEKVTKELLMTKRELVALRAQFDDATTHYTDELNNFKMIAKDATENQTIIRLQNQNNSLQKQMRVNITQLSKAQEEQKQAKETILILESLLEKDEVGKEQVENKELRALLVPKRKKTERQEDEQCGSKANQGEFKTLSMEVKQTMDTVESLKKKFHQAVTAKNNAERCLQLEIQKRGDEANERSIMTEKLLAAEAKINAQKKEILTSVLSTPFSQNLAILESLICQKEVTEKLREEVKKRIDKIRELCEIVKGMQKDIDDLNQSRRKFKEEELEKVGNELVIEKKKCLEAQKELSKTKEFLWHYEQATLDTSDKHTINRLQQENETLRNKIDDMKGLLEDFDRDSNRVIREWTADHQEKLETVSAELETEKLKRLEVEEILSGVTRELWYWENSPKNTSKGKQIKRLKHVKKTLKQTFTDELKVVVAAFETTQLIAQNNFDELQKERDELLSFFTPCRYHKEKKERRMAIVNAISQTEF